MDVIEHTVNALPEAARKTGSESLDTESIDTLARSQSFARKLETGRALLIQNPLCRPALYRILVDCSAGRYLLAQLEEHIQDMPEFAHVTQPPYFLIRWLVDAGALNVTELDEGGQAVTPERKKGLTEDEVDDLVAGFAYCTSELGNVLRHEFDPSNRLGILLAEVPERYGTYMELLEFLTEKRSFKEVDALLSGREVLMSGRKPGERPIHTSVFIDKLAAVGIAVYDGGWQITPEGRDYIEKQ